jgi:predicted RNA-binding protein
MCLSRVYLKERDDGNLMAEEVAKVIDDHGTIRINTIFGEEKELNNYFIKEVNLTESYLILRGKEEE